MTFTTIHQDKVRNRAKLRITGLHMRKSASEHLVHHRKVIRLALALFDLEPSIRILTRFTTVKNNHRPNSMATLYIGVVICFYTREKITGHPEC